MLPFSPPTGRVVRHFPARVLFRVDSGECEYDPEDECVTSPGWPAPYGMNTACNITLIEASHVRTEFFDIELYNQTRDLTEFGKSRSCG